MGLVDRSLRIPAAQAGPVCHFPPPFSPAAWNQDRGQGDYLSVTPQKGKPLIPIGARNRGAWEAERSQYLAAWREIVGGWPDRPALGPTVTAVAETDAYTRYRVTYQTLPGLPYASTIPAWMLVPKGSTGPRPAIVCLHQTIPQGKDEPAGVNASLPWYAFADYYARRGYVTLAPDAIGYGERTQGCYGDTGFELSDAWPILQSRPDMTLLGLMLFDVTRAVDFLETRSEVDGQRIGVIGHSLGGILVNGVLGLERRFKAGVASCGYGIFRHDGYFDRWAGSSSAYLPRFYRYRIKRTLLPVDLLQVMALAAPTPHLVQTALLDSIWTPPAVATDSFVAKELKRVHQLYGSAPTFVSLQENGDHGWYPDAQAAADTFFEGVLRP